MRLSNSPRALRFGKASQRCAARILCGAGYAVVLFFPLPKTRGWRAGNGQTAQMKILFIINEPPYGRERCRTDQCARRSTMDKLAEATATADKVLIF